MVTVKTYGIVTPDGIGDAEWEPVLMGNGFIIMRPTQITLNRDGSTIQANDPDGPNNTLQPLCKGKMVVTIR